MTLVASALTSARMSAIQSIPGITINNTSELQAFLSADSNAIVTYLTANATIPPGILVQVSPTTGTGATTGPGTLT